MKKQIEENVLEFIGANVDERCNSQGQRDAVNFTLDELRSRVPDLAQSIIDMVVAEIMSRMFDEETLEAEMKREADSHHYKTWNYALDDIINSLKQ